MSHRIKNGYINKQIDKKWKNKKSQNHFRAKHQFQYGEGDGGYWSPEAIDSKTRKTAKSKWLRRHYKKLIEDQVRKEQENEYESENSQYIEEQAQNNVNRVCVNCNFVNKEDTQFCAVCCLSLADSVLTFEPKGFEKKSKLNLEQINMSNRGKGKMRRYKLLQKHFLPLLQQFYATLYAKYWPASTAKRPINQYRYGDFLRSVATSDLAKYYEVESKITCVAPDYLLKRLDLVFHENASLNEKPLIVFTTKYEMKCRSRKLDKKAKQTMLEQNKVIQYYLHINGILVRGFGLIHSEQALVPEDVNELILAFYGNNAMNVFDLLLLSNNNLVECSEHIHNMNQWLQTKKEVVIGLSMHKQVFHYQWHLMIPIFNVKLKHVSDKKAALRKNRLKHSAYC